MTKSQINRIGDKLRAPGPPDENTLEQLQEIRSLYGPSMAIAQTLLKERLAIEATARLKTVNTIVEKFLQPGGMSKPKGSDVYLPMSPPTEEELMTNFLLVYRRSTGELLKCEDLGPDPADALERRASHERLNRGDPDIEVVVLIATDRQALMQTHSRYFKDVGQLATDLGALAESSGNRNPD